uniref:Large ribosomal subunit protein eL24 n=1 Tax=Myripristis murdjan TaxID=586833 RepID=A0A667Z5N1_9TELE
SRVELCSFSGYKIYPGHGRRYVFQFLNAKCESAFLAKRNPRQINWTVLYRRKHKKGQSEEVTKKRTRRAVKFQRAITGASLAEIMAKRNQKPEVRKAQREQAIRKQHDLKGITVDKSLNYHLKFSVYMPIYVSVVCSSTRANEDVIACLN